MAIPTFTDFLNIRMVGEYFYATMVTQNDSFGFNNLYGWNIYPEFEILPFGSDMFLQISPFARFPLVNFDEVREETIYGIKIKVPLGSDRSMRFPVYAYQKALIFKFYYNKIRYRFEQQGFISNDIEMSQYVGTLGFNF